MEMIDHKEIAIKAAQEVYEYVSPLFGAKIDESLVRAHLFAIIEKAAADPAVEASHYYCDEGTDEDPTPVHRCNQNAVSGGEAERGYRLALEGMVAAFDGDGYGNATIIRITRECAMSVAKQTLGWVSPEPAPSTPADGGGCEPSGLERGTVTVDEVLERFADYDIKDESDICTPTAAPAVPADKTLAAQIHDARCSWGMLKSRIEDELDDWWSNIDRIATDYHDNSLEVYFEDHVVDLEATTEQQEQIWAWGFGRFWLNFKGGEHKGGTERFYVRARSQGSK